MGVVSGMTMSCRKVAFHGLSPRLLVLIFSPPPLVQCYLNFREDGISVLFGAEHLTVTFSRHLV